uniref:RRM domain-containing protein n=1 Tax=Steinernema glaseri TaxID=37863 RepID=A0A1I7ZHL6_9BILA
MPPLDIPATITLTAVEDLKDMMRDAGEVTYADAHKIQKREGVICFATRSYLDRALDKFQGKEINGRRIKLIDDTRRRGGPHSPVKRTRSRSPVKRSRSRSPVKRSRSRSPSKRSRSRSPSKLSFEPSPSPRSLVMDETERSCSPA